MNPVLAYFLGILTMILIIFPFWYVSTKDSKTKELYDEIFCRSDF